jgi:hypothetical protein
VAAAGPGPYLGVMLTAALALATASAFTGAALYINVAEQPARLSLDDRALLAEWKPAYARGLAMQVPLVLAAGLLGAAAWWTGGGVSCLAGALVMLANLPWTLLAILPTNRVLMATDPAAADGATRALIRRWNALHAVRTGLGGAAALCFLRALA